MEDKHASPTPAKNVEAVELQPLPPSPARLAGETVVDKETYHIRVSTKAGYLCQVYMRTRFKVPPDVIFALFTHPDNSGAFRDIKAVPYRKVVEQAPGWKVVEVQQVGELRILWMRPLFSTHMLVEEDARNPAVLITKFSLLKSDVLSKYNGRWELRPVFDNTGKAIGTDAELHQNVMPKGVPSFMAHLPILGGILRKISVTAVERILQDFEYVTSKWTPETDLSQLLKRVAAERGYKPSENPQGWEPRMQSHAVNDMEDDDEEDSAGALVRLQVDIGVRTDGSVCLTLNGSK